MTSSRRSCCPLRAALAGSAALAVVFAAAAAQAQDTATVEELRELSIEELANVEITSVSRRAEPLSGAASAVYVISGDDVRSSGYQSLPELLRLAPNLQVARIDALDYSITARGFSGFESANKLLVLIDGRSVYTPLYSGVDWDQHDLVLGDVERIEVISGPGGALYGANAVNGVINVLTRSAADTQGALVQAAAGTLDSHLSGRYGGRLGESGAWRVYASAFQRGPMRGRDGDEANDDYDGWQAGFRTDWDAGSTLFTVQGDLFDHTLDSSIGIPGGYARGGNLLARWTHSFSADSAFELQGYYDRSERVARGIYGRLDTLDIEGRQTLTLGRHRLVAGGGYRVSEDDFANLIVAAVTLMPQSEQVSIGNVYAQDQIALREDLTLTAALKLEHNSYTGLEALPSLRLAWQPTEQALFWAAVSRAVRNPSRI